MTADTIDIDTSNEEQLAAWDGGEGAFWADHADWFDRALAPHHDALMATAGIAPPDTVLDIGCGAGQTTIDAAVRASGGWATGVDLSTRLLDVARRRAQSSGVANITFDHADAQVHPFEPASFDIALSRTGAMFFGDPVAGFGNIRRALRAEGRLALLTWQGVEGNEWLEQIAVALAVCGPPRIPPPGTGPLSLSQPDTVRSLLSTAGFRDVRLQSHEAPMWFGPGADAAYDFILGRAGWMLEGATDEERVAGQQALRRLTSAHETSDGVLFRSAAWLITATAA